MFVTHEVTNVDPAGPYCDADELANALLSADLGDEVAVGECTVVGAFTVPSGVTLLGAGRGRSVLQGDGDGPLVRRSLDRTGSAGL